MLDHLKACLPEEACGLLGGLPADLGRGQPARCTAVLPVTNADHSPVRFSMDPEEQLRAFHWIEEQGLELVGIFHSHPTGPSHPSATDLAEFAYPGVLYLIWSPGAHGPDWQLHAFRIDGGAYSVVELVPGSSNPGPPAGL